VAEDLLDRVEGVLLLRDSRLLASALRELRTSTNPPRTVTGLALRLGVSRTRLWPECKSVVADEIPLATLLAAELVSTVDRLRRSGLSPASALRVLGIDRRRYHHAARLLTSRRLE
jgi:hypothetical protein